MKRSAATTRGLVEFMLELGRATLVGDVIPVVLRHTTALLGADSARLVVANGATFRCWTMEHDRITSTTLDPDDALLRLPAGTTPSAVADRGGITVEAPADQALVARRTPGADDFLLLEVRRRRRSFDDRARSLLTSIFTFSDVALQNVELLSRLQDKAAALEHLATHDPLTGLANRRRFREEAEAAISHGHAGAVLLIDLDRFKEVNDTLGHQVGDQLLVEVAQRLRRSVGRHGVIARLGGDEFAVLLEPGTEAELTTRAQRIHGALERPVDLGDVTVDVGASIGVAATTDDEQPLSSLMRHADVAMYAAKAARTDVEAYAPDLDHYRPESLALVARFRDAIERGELHVAYQPQFDTTTDRVVGAEALARWSVPGTGPIPPSEFIPIAESTGLIRPLTRHILLDAIQQCTSWQTDEDRVRVSVNIAPRVLLDPGFTGQISDLLDVAGLPPDLLRLEVTETTVMTDPDRAAAVLRDLVDNGVTVAIDDFGTGHSSLAYLTSLPCHEIKIDRSFITALEHGDPRSIAVVASIIGLGRDLGIDVIAEGVETPCAAEELQRLGCRVVQGFLYSRPVGASELTRVLAGTPLEPPHLGPRIDPGGPAPDGRLAALT